MQNTSYSNLIQIECDESINEEINNFNEQIHGFAITNFEYCEMYPIIQSSIARYLIQESYNKLNQEQIVDFYKDFVVKPSKKKKIKIEEWDPDEYIDLKYIGSGSLSEVKLVFEIESQKLYAIKMQRDIKYEKDNYNTREYENYLNLDYPLLPKLYNVYKFDDKLYFLKIQFINGETLEFLEKEKLTFDDIIFIILQLMLIINYFHEKRFVYRDLKPDNIIVDANKTVFIIDFDRLISEKANILNEQEHSKNFSHKYVAPEVNLGQITRKSDIYSLGKIIEYNFNNELIDFKSLVDENPNNRPWIYGVFHHFNDSFSQQINRLKIINTPEIQYFQSITHTKADIKSAIHYYTLAANQNFIDAIIQLGVIYYNGEYVTRDINKTIHYYTLAANQNHPVVQSQLGLIYYNGEYITKDINKAMHYFTLAANQNDPEGLFQLGLISYEGKYITRDINKSIHYFILSANQNHQEAQFMLGLIYYENRDINKSLHYYTLSANNNFVGAQFNLGQIYYNGEYVMRDINKSIHYFKLASNHNYITAQLKLAIIYFEGLYIKININESIHYFTLAVNQNDPYAQFYLGLIYGEGKYITRDINKSIHYFTLAANKDDSDAQYNLGFIYYNGKYITQDINKSIYYFTLAANHNQTEALFNLGFIYYQIRDINKSIHYYALAAKQNEHKSQFNLGLIYFNGKYITKDINKAIHYFTLAANQNHPKAQFNLGEIYHNGEYITRDINKSIHYFTLAANQNYPEALFNLGAIYHNGEYITRDINKAIHYLTLSANQNDPSAQFNLGVLNLIEKNINRALNLLDKSSNSGDIRASFTIGYLYHEGKYLNKNITKCIKYYKYASSFNNFYSKNNLGVIYKNGICEIPKNIGYAIEYFEEAVQRWKDKLSMYNLAHIYIYMKLKMMKKSMNQSNYLSNHQIKILNHQNIFYVYH